MAKFSEVINKRSLEDEDFDPKYFTVRDTTGGLTDALYTNRGIDALGGVNAIPSWMSAEGVEYTDHATVPSYKDIIAAIPDLKDDAGAKEGKKGARTALQKFVEDFPKMQGQWKKDLLGKDKNLGERGWDTVKEIWKQTVSDYYDEQAKKARAAVVDDGTATGLITKLLFPRMTNAIREGRDVDLDSREFAGDVFQNLAYMVPAGFAAAPVKFTASKILPAAAQGAAKTAASFASQAAAPLAVYGADKVLGNETSLVDPIVGTLGNMGANKVLFPTIGRMAGRLTGSIRNPQLRGVRALLEGADTPREKGLKLIDEKKQFLKYADKPKSEILLTNMESGRPNDVTVKAIEEAQDIARLGDLVNKPGRLEETAKDLVKRYTPEEQSKIAAISVVDALADQSAKNIIKETSKQAGVPVPKGKVGDLVQEQTKQLEAARLDGVAGRYADIFDKHPELYAVLFKQKYPRLTDLGVAYGVNKFADISTRPAEAAANAYGIPIKEWKQEDDAERAEAKRQSDLAKAIENVRLTLDSKPGITAQDEAFLADIKANPSLVVNGYPDMRKNNEFKEWLLLRGHDILRGTAASRPTWDVE